MKRYSAYEFHSRGHHRRGAVIVVTVVSLVVLLSFAALTVDVGAIYNTRADLQRAADAGAMAAALALADVGSRQDPLVRAEHAASSYVSRNIVMGRKVSLGSGDVDFGRANYDGRTNSYNFVSTTVLPDAVRVRVRCTRNSPNGPIPLYFARIFGRSSAEVSAEAVAVIAPRDIAIAADVSGSLVYDSMLKNYDDRKINFFDVWDGLPGGFDDDPSTWAPDELPPDPAQAAGPAWGYLKKLNFGTDPGEDGYDPAADPGLIRLSTSGNWSDAALRADLAARGYNVAEIAAITAGGGSYELRVAVALGLADWNSGTNNGLWEMVGIPGVARGDRDDRIESNELLWNESIFERGAAESAEIWRDYVNFQASNRRDEFRYLFGVKTFIEFLLEEREGPDDTPQLSAAPVQPFEAVKDGVSLLTRLLDEYETGDLVSLETYSLRAVHTIDLTESVALIAERLRSMSPNHHGAGTNIGGGLERAIEELTSERARASARKVIVIFTDGRANADRGGYTSAANAIDYAVEQAERAAALGMQIITVSVGQDADQELMEKIADIGLGVHFHAEGSIDAYSAQLAAIFQQIGGRRTVELIQ